MCNHEQAEELSMTAMQLRKGLNNARQEPEEHRVIAEEQRQRADAAVLAIQDALRSTQQEQVSKRKK